MKVPNMSEDSGISHIHVVVEATRISSLFKKVRVTPDSLLLNHSPSCLSFVTQK